MNENFATKADIKSEMRELRWEIQTLDSKFESRFKEIEYKLTIKLGSMMALSIGFTATLVKLISIGGH